MANGNWQRKEIPVFLGMDADSAPDKVGPGYLPLLRNFEPDGGDLRVRDYLRKLDFSWPATTGTSGVIVGLARAVFSDRTAYSAAHDNPGEVIFVVDGGGVLWYLKEDNRQRWRYEPISLGRLFPGAELIRSAQLGDNLIMTDENRMVKAWADDGTIRAEQLAIRPMPGPPHFRAGVGTTGPINEPVAVYGWYDHAADYDSGGEFPDNYSALFGDVTDWIEPSRIGAPPELMGCLPAVYRLTYVWSDGGESFPGPRSEPYLLSAYGWGDWRPRPVRIWMPGWDHVAADKPLYAYVYRTISEGAPAALYGDGSVGWQPYHYVGRVPYGEPWWEDYEGFTTGAEPPTEGMSLVPVAKHLEVAGKPERLFSGNTKEGIDQQPVSDEVTHAAFNDAWIPDLTDFPKRLRIEVAPEKYTLYGGALLLQLQNYDDSRYEAAPNDVPPYNTSAPAVQETTAFQEAAYVQASHLVYQETEIISERETVNTYPIKYQMTLGDGRTPVPSQVMRCLRNTSNGYESMELFIQMPQGLPASMVGLYFYYDEDEMGGQDCTPRQQYLGMRLPFGSDDDFRCNGGLYPYGEHMRPACSSQVFSFLNLEIPGDPPTDVAHDWDSVGEIPFACGDLATEETPPTCPVDPEAATADIMRIRVRNNMDLTDTWFDEAHQDWRTHTYGYASPGADDYWRLGAHEYWMEPYANNYRERRVLAIPRVTDEGGNTWWTLYGAPGGTIQSRTTNGDIRSGSCRAFVYIHDIEEGTEQTPIPFTLFYLHANWYLAVHRLNTAPNDLIFRIYDGTTTHEHTITDAYDHVQCKLFYVGWSWNESAAYSLLYVQQIGECRRITEPADEGQPPVEEDVWVELPQPADVWEDQPDFAGVLASPTPRFLGPTSDDDEGNLWLGDIVLSYRCMTEREHERQAKLLVEPHVTASVLDESEEIGVLEEEPARGRWSETDDPHDWPVLSYRDMGSKGNPIHGVGSERNHVVFCKEEGAWPMLVKAGSAIDFIGEVADTSVGISETVFWNPETISPETRGWAGCSVPGAVLSTPDGIWMVSGPRLLRYSGGRFFDHSKGVETILRGATNWANKAQVRLFYEPRRRNLLLGWDDGTAWRIIGIRPNFVSGQTTWGWFEHVGYGPAVIGQNFGTDENSLLMSDATNIFFFDAMLLEDAFGALRARADLPLLRLPRAQIRGFGYSADQTLSVAATFAVDGTEMPRYISMIPERQYPAPAGDGYSFDISIEGLVGPTEQTDPAGESGVRGTLRAE